MRSDWLAAHSGEPIVAVPADSMSCNGSLASRAVSGFHWGGGSTLHLHDSFDHSFGILESTQQSVRAVVLRQQVQLVRAEVLVLVDVGNGLHQWTYHDLNKRQRDVADWEMSRRLLAMINSPQDHVSICTYCNISIDSGVLWELLNFSGTKSIQIPIRKHWFKCG